MSYRDTLLALAGNAEARVQAVLQRLLDGDLTEEQLRAVVVAIIANANQQAADLASLSLAATLEVSLGQPVPVVASAPDPLQDAVRIAAAVAAVRAVTDPDGGLLRLGALGRHEPIGTATTTYSDVIHKSNLVTGWSRQTSPNACGLCQDWAKGDPVWPTSFEMFHHKGCTCTQTPITTER